MASLVHGAEQVWRVALCLVAGEMLLNE